MVEYLQSYSHRHCHLRKLHHTIETHIPGHLPRSPLQPAPGPREPLISVPRDWLFFMPHRNGVMYHGLPQLAT